MMFHPCHYHSCNNSAHPSQGQSSCAPSGGNIYIFNVFWPLFVPAVVVALSKVAVVRAQYINVTGSLGDHGGVGIELSLALLRAGDPSIDRSSETKAVVTSIFIFNWPTNHSDPALCGMIAGHLPDETLGIKRESRWNHARTGIIKCSPPSLSSSSLHQW